MTPLGIWLVLGASTTVIVALGAVFLVVELSLLVWALVDLLRRPVELVTGKRKWPWLLLALLVSGAGPILYLVLGRQPATVPEPPRARADSPAVAAAVAAGSEAPDTATGAPAADAGAAPAQATRETRPTVPPAPAPGPDPARAAASLYGPAAEGAPALPASVPPAVELTNVTKSYGPNDALAGLDLVVPAGSVFGFLGPNGAGKTTTLRILAGLAAATSGSAKVLGREAASAGAAGRAHVGYLPDVPAFYGWMTAAQYLRFAGSLFGLRGAELEARISTLLELADLADVKSHVGGFSRGMKQRLGVAQALINAPSLLLLDEPTSALDPIGRRELLDMIAALRGRTTVFFSTHILADVERVCDTVAIIDHGRVVTQAGIDELRRRRGGRHRLVVEVDDGARLARDLEGAPWLLSLAVDDEGALRLAVDDVQAAERELPARIARLGLALRRLDADELSLEEVFVRLVGENGGGKTGGDGS